MNRHIWLIDVEAEMVGMVEAEMVGMSGRENIRQ